MRVRTGVRLGLAALLAVALPLVGSGAAQAKDKRELTVMTQNLYLGSSLTPALTATTGPEFVAAVAQIYGTVVFTNFPHGPRRSPTRSQPSSPTWSDCRRSPTGSPRPPAAASPPSFDFLAILQAAARPHAAWTTSVASVSQNADIGPAPLVAPAFGCGVPNPAPACVVTLQDRDVILVNARHRRSRLVQARRAATTPPSRCFQPPVGPARCRSPAAGPRSTASSRASSFRFVNTHLEVEDFAAVQEAQAQEFLAGPARGRGRRHRHRRLQLRGGPGPRPAHHDVRRPDEVVVQRRLVGQPGPTRASPAARTAR